MSQEGHHIESQDAATVRNCTEKNMKPGDLGKRRQNICRESFELRMKETGPTAKAKEQMESLKGAEFPVRGWSGLDQRR